MKKPGMKKPDGTREKVGHYSRSPENCPLQGKSRRKKSNPPQDSSKPNINLEKEDTLPFFEDDNLRIGKALSAGEKKEHVEKETVRQRKCEYESNLSVEEERSCSETLIEGGGESSNESLKPDSNSVAEESKPTEKLFSLDSQHMSYEVYEEQEIKEKLSSQDSYMPCEEYEDEQQTKGFAMLYKNFVWTLKKMSPINVISLYETSVKCEFGQLKEMCVESLKASLSTSGIRDVLAFADENKETELLDYALAFLKTRYMDIVLTEEWQSFNSKDPNKVNELLKRVFK